MTVAHRQLAIPSLSASLLIAGLHQLRDGISRADGSELRALHTARLTTADKDDIVQLATATGALEPARELLLSLGLEERELPRPTETLASREWRARTDANASGAFFWLLLLERTPRRDRLALLWRAIWPTRETLRINHPDSPDTLMVRIALRVARVPGGIRSIPAAVRAMNNRRRGRRSVH